VTPLGARQQAEAQAEDLVNHLGRQWQCIPAGVRRLTLATLANPAARSDVLLLLAGVLDEFAGSITSTGRHATAMTQALCALAAALTALAPSRA
jgi:hypothetical protein